MEITQSPNQLCPPIAGGTGPTGQPPATAEGGERSQSNGDVGQADRLESRREPRPRDLQNRAPARPVPPERDDRGGFRLRGQSGRGQIQGRKPDAGPGTAPDRAVP